MVVGGGSQRLLSLNPTTVMVVLLLGLWLLLGCDKNISDNLMIPCISEAFAGDHCIPGVTVCTRPLKCLNFLCQRDSK